MMARANIAADLAAAAARRLWAELDGEVSNSAKVAKRTVRDQLLEAAYNLSTGNIPIHTNEGFLIKSKSSNVGKLATLKAGGLTIEKVGEEYVVVSGGIVERVVEPVLEFYVQSGKTYMVTPDALTCTCGGAALHKTCWHLCAVEFWCEAGILWRRGSTFTISRSANGVRNLTGKSRSRVSGVSRRGNRKPADAYAGGRRIFQADISSGSRTRRENDPGGFH